MSNVTAQFDSQQLQGIMTYELFNVPPQEREDIKQECYAKIIKALRKNPNVPADKYKGFAQKIIKCTKVDLYRRKVRKIETSTIFVCFSDNASFGYTEVDDQVDGRDVFCIGIDDLGYELADIRADYHFNKHTFTPQEQKAIQYMLDNDGVSMTFKEVSELTGVHKSHVTRAVKKLKQICA